MVRQCSRPMCSESATATLTYVYAQGLVEIHGLSGSRDPNDYDLCARHADRVKVPNGWRLHDRRGAAFLPSRLAG